tara:strand:- start:9077 stop:9268 length:192 start_codon:yes stop_codon:yes gene_type:complete
MKLKMTDQKFIDEVYEIAFGDNARHRLTKEQAPYEHNEVLEQLKQFEQWSLKWEELKRVGCFE